MYVNSLSLWIGRGWTSVRLLKSRCLLIYISAGNICWMVQPYFVWLSCSLNFENNTSDHSVVITILRLCVVPTSARVEQQQLKTQTTSLSTNESPKSITTVKRSNVLTFIAWWLSEVHFLICFHIIYRLKNWWRGIRSPDERQKCVSLYTAKCCMYWINLQHCFAAIERKRSGVFTSAKLESQR